MSENWNYQWSGKDASGGMLNVRAETPGGLRDAISELFGLGSDQTILVGFFSGAQAPQPVMSPQQVASSFNGEVVTPQFVPQAAAPSSDGQTCPTCGVGKLALRNGKKGKFYGCSNFPNCRHTQDA